MRFVCGDVRDLIVSHKTDHGPAHRRYRALQRWSCLKICFREIFGIVRFSTFATISVAERTRRPKAATSESDPGCSLIPGLRSRLSKNILAGFMVLSAVGACPPHDGVG
jgi:hypothetical protein